MGLQLRWAFIGGCSYPSMGNYVSVQVVYVGGRGRLGCFPGGNYPSRQRNKCLRLNNNYIYNISYFKIVINQWVRSIWKLYCPGQIAMWREENPLLGLKRKFTRGTSNEVILIIWKVLFDLEKMIHKQDTELIGSFG